MALAHLEITEYTDPACPFAFSAEPFRLRLLWELGEQVRWTSRLVVLSESSQEYLDKGMDAELLATSGVQLGERYGMPIDGTVKSHPPATRPACTAVVAARLHAPDRYERLLRGLRVRNFSGELLDEWTTIAAAAADADIDAGDLQTWIEQEDVRTAVEEDMAAARNPSTAALAMDHKLAGWERDGRKGRRYTCPSLTFTRVADGATLVAPGFHQWAVYDTLVANLAPLADRRPADDVVEVLRWAGHKLATQEVAEITGRTRDEARERLAAAGAIEEPVGTDAYWSLPA